MPPLIKGMPVALQDHISSNLELLLLRGKVGKIHSWVDHGAEDSACHDGIRVLTCVPKVVFVKFEAGNGYYQACPSQVFVPSAPGSGPGLSIGTGKKQY